MKAISKLAAIIMALACIMSSPRIYAQGKGGIRGAFQIHAYNTNTQLTGTVTKQTKTPDYALYRNVVRRNLWLEGQGEPISQATADKLPCYFKLSMKNDKGHYQFVQAMCGKELTSNHTISPYIKDKQILSPTDTVANPWNARFSTIGQWLITSDLAGDRVVEERAYEAKADGANLIYAFQPIYNDSTHITGSYTDSWGLPIDIDNSGNHYYGSVVYITLNDKGLDYIVDHLDAKGLCRYNEYGVDQTRYEYDDKDRLISVSSHNTVGDRVNNNRGYCAILYQYNDADNTCTVTYVDKNLQPVESQKPCAEE